MVILNADEGSISGVAGGRGTSPLPPLPSGPLAPLAVRVESLLETEKGVDVDTAPDHPRPPTAHPSSSAPHSPHPAPTILPPSPPPSQPKVVVMPLSGTAVLDVDPTADLAPARPESVVATPPPMVETPLVQPIAEDRQPSLHRSRRRRMCPHLPGGLRWCPTPSGHGTTASFQSRQCRNARFHRWEPPVWR